MRDLGSKFDVIIIEPPLEEYQRSQGAVFDKYWSWEDVSTNDFHHPTICAVHFSFTFTIVSVFIMQIERLEINEIAAQRSFLWIWCGSSDGLDYGRKVCSPFSVHLSFHMDPNP